MPFPSRKDSESSPPPPLPPVSPTSSTNVYNLRGAAVSPPTPADKRTQQPGGATPSTRGDADDDGAVPHTPSPNSIRATPRSPKRPRTPTKPPPVRPFHPHSPSTCMKPLSAATTTTTRRTLAAMLAKQQQQQQQQQQHVERSLVGTASASANASGIASVTGAASSSKHGLAVEARGLPVARALIAEFDAVMVDGGDGAAAGGKAMNANANASGVGDDDFFAEGHRRVQTAFAQRWNWDVVHDCPMEGAWRWELVKRPSEATTA